MRVWLDHSWGPLRSAIVNGLIVHGPPRGPATTFVRVEAVRLLGPFDSFLLAHATKEHLVEPRHYKRVYRPQGWISPVVLCGASIAGVWFPKTSGKTTTLSVELFARPTPATRKAIEREAGAMAAFLGQPCVARFA